MDALNDGDSMSAVLYGSPMTSWDGGRDAPDPNCSRFPLTPWRNVCDLRNDREQPIFVERLGNVGCKAGFQASGNVIFIDAPAHGNCRNDVALHYAMRARAQSGQELEARAIGQPHVANK